MSTQSKRHTWAIVPARSGSRGFKDKNVSSFLGIPLLAHSVNFAHKLSFVDRVVVSTDSKAYAELAQAHGASVPFLRGEAAAADTSMEEHVLDDIRLACAANAITPPTDVVWLRPTHPLRDLDSFETAWNLHIATGEGVCVVVPEDPRIFLEGKNGHLSPIVEDFHIKSMVRRQDCPRAFRIFGGEIFSFPQTFEPLFLGDTPRFVVAPDACHFDIDHHFDLQRLEALIQNTETGGRYEGLVHRN